MRVRLKGINKRTKRLRSGEVKTYHYAWKGGPALVGEPGSPAFVESYNAAHAARAVKSADTLGGVLNAFQRSAEWDRLAARTQIDYRKKIVEIEGAFGDLPVTALADRRMRNEFLTWRDDLAKKSKRQADLAWSVLARILSWALGRHLVEVNPCKAGGRIYKAGARRDKVWSADQEAAFLAHAGERMSLAFLLALHTGQRQGDLLHMPWSAFDGETITLKQSKTGARVCVPVTAALKARLVASPRNGRTILTTRDGAAWTGDGFRSSWRKACIKAKISGVTFHDLRGTAVTRLAVAGCTEAEIATITGHTLSEVGSILSQTYLKRDHALAQSAIAKLEAQMKTPDQTPDRAEVSEDQPEKV